MEQTKDTKVSEKIKITCRICKNKTNHLILSDVSQSGIHQYDETTFVEWFSSYEIVQCQGCDTVSFRKTSKDSTDMIQITDEIDDYVVHENIYPNPEETRPLIEDFHIFPNDLKRIYGETIKAVNMNQPVLTGIGIRAIVETVCKEQQASGKNLALKIDDLVSQGKLTRDGADILHNLRVLGNKAAHEVKPHDSVQLGLALDVIDHLLKGVYILPVHAQTNFT